MKIMPKLTIIIIQRIAKLTKMTKYTELKEPHTTIAGLKEMPVSVIR